jgi:hypothetical protein
MRTVHSLVLWLALALHAASALAENSLCRAGEINFSSCSVGNKVASFCASKNLGAENGYFQYRFGTPKNVNLFFRLSGTFQRESSLQA